MSTRSNIVRLSTLGLLFVAGCSGEAPSATANGSRVGANAAPGQSSSTVAFSPAAAPFARCLAAVPGDTASESALTLQQCGVNIQQAFQLEPTGELRTIQSQCVDASGAQSSGTGSTMARACDDSLAQHWAQTTAGELRSSTGQCITQTGDSSIVVSVCDGSGSQQWLARALVLPSVFSLTRDTLTLPSLGDTAQLRAIQGASDVDSSLVTWTSLDPTVISVSHIGLITAQLVGSAIVVASYQGATDSVVVRVDQTVGALSIAPATVALVPSQITPLAATATDVRGNVVASAPVTWSSSAANVATVGVDGLVTGVAPGTATITASIGRIQASAAVSVSAAPAVIPTRLLSADTVRLPFGGKFGFALTNAGTAPVHYSASVGAITASGAYTAPNAATTATIVAADAAGHADTAVVTVSATRFGVHSDIAWSQDANFRSTMIANLASEHAQVARVELLWAFIEWTKGHPDWTVPDAIVNGLTAAGIAPLFVIDGSPPWANGVGENQDPNYYLFVPTSDSAFQQWVTSYTAFIKQAATRYKGKVKLWEIGNEPNDPAFWKPQIDVDRYAKWYVAMDSTIRSVDNTNATALGGLAALPVWNGTDGMSGRDFLQAIYDRGIHPANVAIHPYSNQGQAPDVHITGAQNFDDIQMIHDLMVQNGQGAAGLWVTEWGWNTRTVSEAVQADYVERSLELIASRYSYVSLAIDFSQFDSNAASYGLLRADGTAKASADRFRKFLAR